MTARRLPLRRSAALGALVALALAALASADPGGHVTATSGAVTATLTWQKGAPIGGVSDPHLVIVRSGSTALDADLGLENCSACSLLNGDSTPPLSVVDLNGDGEPEVLVDTFSGGVHCCYSSLIYRFSGGGYVLSTALWGDMNVSIADLDGDGRPELRTAADEFAYAFTTFGQSHLPPLIYDFTSDGRFVDVTAKFPAIVSADATRVLALVPIYRHAHRDLRGLVAAYVADQATLKRQPVGLAFLATERKNHDLGSDAHAKAFETALGKLLAKYHYT